MVGSGNSCREASFEGPKNCWLRWVSPNSVGMSAGNLGHHIRGRGMPWPQVKMTPNWLCPVRLCKTVFNSMFFCLHDL